MYGWIRPQLLVPVHGEMRHMMEQARFGLANGIPRALVQNDGEIVRLAPGEPEKLGYAPVGRLMLDGDVILPADVQEMQGLLPQLVVSRVEDAGHMIPWDNEAGFYAAFGDFLGAPL